MCVTEKVWELYSEFGNNATMEAGRKLEEARTIEEEEFYSSVLDELLDMMEEG